MGQHEHDHCDTGPSNAEGEVAIARLVLEDNDFTHALRHIADALALDPSLPETHEALAELVARAGGPEAALGHFEDAGGEEFIGTVAARAQVCAAAGRWNDAIYLLFTVAAHEPERSWLDVTWLRRPDLPDLVDPGVILTAVATLIPRLDDPIDEDRRAPPQPALDLIRGCVARHPEHAMLLWCGSGLARRLGAFDEAIAWTERAYEIQPSHEAAVMKGYALRGAGRMDDALTVWTEEIERTPDDLELYVDVAELLHAMDRTADGLDWARRAAERDPTHPKAVPVVHGLSFALDNDVQHLVALADQVRAEPDHPYAATVLMRHCAGRPWLGQVSAPREAVCNMLSQVLEDQEPNPDLKLEVTVSGIEPPSALLTLQAVFPSATVNIDQIGKPDPRDSVRRVRHVVWKYRRKVARPAVPMPALDVATAVHDIATVDWFSPLDAYDRAVVLSGFEPKGLLGVLVHPPAPPDDERGQLFSRRYPQLWLRAVQTWACLGIAHHHTDQPWPSSRRREILADLLDGPEDWVSEAAAFALVVTAWVDPSTREDVQALVVGRLLAADAAHATREVTILWSLCHLVLATPGLTDQSATLARGILNRLEVGA